MHVSNEATRQDLERELATHARIGNHPHLVELYGMFRAPDTGQLCVVMQYMAGTMQAPRFRAREGAVCACVSSAIRCAAPRRRPAAASVR
jgi:hypothetical protein